MEETVLEGRASAFGARLRVTSSDDLARNSADLVIPF